MVRIASYNVENLFARPKALDPADWSVGKPALKAYHEVNALLAQPDYDPATKEEIRRLLVELDIYYLNNHGAARRRLTQDPLWAWLRKNRGSFDEQPANLTRNVEITAAGRADWIGWVELATEQLDEVGVRMTARVIRDVNADIIGIIEAEDRPALVRMNAERLAGQYGHVMLIDGNDRRGIDVGIMTRAGFPIESIRSNVDTADVAGIVFSRDCPQYEVRTPGGMVVHVLVNHFKSQSGGGGAKRQRQAAAVRSIVDGLVDRGLHVIVLGDLNEGPAAAGSPAANLADLYAGNSPLVECYAISGFDPGNRPGTYDSCGLRNRLDYIFISQSLLPHFAGGGVFRNGLWGTRTTRPTAWSTYPEMNGSSEQASDHAAVYVDLAI
jgi:endonuclease/exonuclease/phosphatase family metal-dependent hydrolase